MLAVKKSDDGSDVSEEEEYFLVGQDSYEATRLLDKKNGSALAADVGVEEEEKTKYPKVVFFIMANEFCERFSYYGMKAVLILYLTTQLAYSDSTATVIYHAFAMLCYFTPLFGAIISDMYLGKFRTIFYISIIYALGNIILSLSAATPLHLPQMELCMIGLALIGLGTGGIKPCVAAFGGDQFHPKQEKERQQFFSIFYFCINAGSLLSTIITPFLREDFPCFNEKSCFTLAFGVPAALMVIALLLFLIGKPSYKIVPPEGNIIVDVFRCISHALGRKMRSSSSDKKEHWLDYADDKFDRKLLEDVKSVLRVLFLYIPLPVFWALFDQQGSRWTLQATKMNGATGMSFWPRVKPDQMQVINPALILIFIPIYETVIYPCLGKCNLLKKPLQRMAVGGLLAAGSFVVAAFVQLKIEASLPAPPASGLSDLTLINTLPCKMNVEMMGSDIPQFAVELNSSFVQTDLKANQTYKMNVTFSDPNCPEASDLHHFTAVDQEAFSLVFYKDRDSNTLQSFQLSTDVRTKPDKGKTAVRLLYVYESPTFFNKENVTIWLRNKNPKGTSYYVPMNFTNAVGFSDYEIIDPSDEYEVFLPDPNNVTMHLQQVAFSFISNPGSAFTYLIQKNNDQVMFKKFVTVEENTMSMFLQVPQYVVITMGEVMFSITGLEFSYSQAPESMKSVLQAAWLLTVAFGNLIVIIITEAEIFHKQSYEFFLFAGLMAVDMLIFILMTLSYKYVEKPDEENEEYTQPDGINNQAYEHDTKM